MDRQKEVYYDQYCAKCKHNNTPETDEPCNECLTNSYNIDSHKPVNFVKKD